MVRYTNKLKLTLWVSAVYVLSFICYVPTLLEQNGIIIPNGLLYLKYGAGLQVLLFPRLTVSYGIDREHFAHPARTAETEQENYSRYQIRADNIDKGGIFFIDNYRIC